MKFVRKGRKVGRIRKGGMEEGSGCSPYLNAKPRQIPLLGTYA